MHGATIAISLWMIKINPAINLQIDLKLALIDTIFEIFNNWNRSHIGPRITRYRRYISHFYRDISSIWFRICEHACRNLLKMVVERYRIV